MIKILVFPFLTLILSLFLLPAFCDRPTDWPDNTLPDLECKHSSLVDCEVNSIDGGFKFNNSNSTVLFAGVVANIRGGDCQIYIKAQYVRFEGSHISGCDIIIEATASVKLDKSTLSVEGSRSALPFSKVDRTIGCSYGGAGGYCGAGNAPDYTYGEYNTPYYDDQNAFGMGASDPHASGDALGGGRIVIITQELVFLEGHLVADGYPKSCPDSFHNYPRGGSGGYIYVSSNSTFIYDSHSTITANGGWGCGGDSLGGSGGRITLYTDVAKPYQFHIQAKGGSGTARKPCSWGAAGTIYYINATSNTGFRVEVNQEDLYKDPLTVPTPTYLRLPAGSNLTNITGVNGATITIKPLEDQGGNWTYNVSGVRLVNGSRLTFAKSSNNIKICNVSLIADYHFDLNSSEISSDCNLTLKASGQFNATRGSFITSTVANTLISIYADLYMMNTSAILFYPSSPLKIYKNTNDGNYETLKYALSDPYWTLNYHNRIALQALSMISTGISIKANNTLINSGVLQSSYIYLRSGNLTNQGSIIATYLTCNSTTLPDRPSILNPINYGLDIQKMLDALNVPRDMTAIYTKIFSDYTIFIVVQNHSTHTGLIQGSRLGVFSNHSHITKRGVITAAGLGCPAEKGPGAGFAVGGTCASTGGAHASNGGIGLDTVAVANSKNCLQSITKSQKLYGDVKNPLQEGSGGGSYKKITGGSGGGVVILGALKDLKVDGLVNANGIGPTKSVEEDNGAGAGSGGSIQLHMRYINGNGTISANGGSLSHGSFGGVGSGGRIRIRLLNWMDEGDLNQNEESLVPLVNKGERNGPSLASLGLAELDIGGEGSLHGNPCPPGYHGALCQPCSAKTYKADFGAGECQKCVVTERAELNGTTTAGQMYMCDFTCKYEVWYQGSPLCLPNIFYYAAYNDQGYLKTIGVLYTLALIASSWKFLKCWGRKKKAKYDQPYLSVHQDQSKDSSQYFNNSHVQRINLLGDNAPESKWFINADTVNLREVEEIREKIDYLIKNINRATIWKKFPMFFLRVFVLCYPPLYFFLLKHFRMKIAKRCSNFIKEMNQELAEYCVLRGLSVYYITLVVDDEASSGYLDLFHDDGENSLRNTLLPVSYTLSGNGKYNSPYFINKNDSMMEHLIKVWTPRNSGLSEKDRTHFQYDFEKFIRKVNKKIKYIDFYSPAPTFKHHLRETVKEVNKYKEIFAKQYAIFLNLTCFEVPRLTVEEVDLTQPFLQSPIRVSVLEDIEHEEFTELTARIQKLKTESEYDIKLYLIVQNGRDLNDIEQKKNESVGTKNHFPKKKKKSLVKQNEYIDVNINNLKENFFNKLDQISFNVEYSLPRNIADASPTVKQQKNRSQNNQKDVYTTSRKYFTSMHKMLDSLLSFKPKTKRAAELYVFMSILIFAQISFIWIRSVAVFGLGQPSAIFYYVLPFPLAPIFAPLFGLLGLFKGDTRKTLYFGVFNACCIANQTLNLAILGAASDTMWSISWKEWVSFLICLITQERIRCLLSVQTKR